MFSYTGLTVPQCANMTENWHCYMLRTGRISFTGLNDHNYEYTAQAFKDSIDNY